MAPQLRLALLAAVVAASSAVAVPAPRADGTPYITRQEIVYRARDASFNNKIAVWIDASIASLEPFAGQEVDIVWASQDGKFAADNVAPSTRIIVGPSEESGVPEWVAGEFDIPASAGISAYKFRVTETDGKTSELDNAGAPFAAPADFLPSDSSCIVRPERVGGEQVMSVDVAVRTGVNPDKVFVEIPTFDADGVYTEQRRFELAPRAGLPATDGYAVYGAFVGKNNATDSNGFLAGEYSITALVDGKNVTSGTFIPEFVGDGEYCK